MGMERFVAEGAICFEKTGVPFRVVMVSVRGLLPSGTVMRTGVPTDTGLGDAEMWFSSLITFATPEVLSMR